MRTHVSAHKVFSHRAIQTCFCNRTHVLSASLDHDSVKKIPNNNLLSLTEENIFCCWLASTPQMLTRQPLPQCHCLVGCCPSICRHSLCRALHKEYTAESNMHRACKTASKEHCNVEPHLVTTTTKDSICSQTNHMTAYTPKHTTQLPVHIQLPWLGPSHAAGTR